MQIEKVVAPPKICIILHITQNLNPIIGQCKTQTADHCFHQANENVTTIVPLFSNPKNSSLQSVDSLHFTLPYSIIIIVLLFII